MKKSIIIAVDENNAIGFNNDLPWPRIPCDMKFFKNKTEGHVVIMGNNTAKSIPAKFWPFPKRLNIVLTHQTELLTNIGEELSEPIIYTDTVGNALNIAQEFYNHPILKPIADFEQQEVFIIGGAQIYSQMIKYNLSNLDKIYLTRIHGSFNADTHFEGIPVGFELIDQRFVDKVFDERQQHSVTFQEWVKVN